MRCYHAAAQKRSWRRPLALSSMLHAWGFERVGVVAGDLYFLDPEPVPRSGGRRAGVRVEVRLLDRPPLTGSIYAAQPIVIDRPVWRADLFETVAGDPGSHDRTHHHPHFRGWEPGRRQFDPALTGDPMGWLADRLGRPTRSAGRGRTSTPARWGPTTPATWLRPPRRSSAPSRRCCAGYGPANWVGRRLRPGVGSRARSPGSTGRRPRRSARCPGRLALGREGLRPALAALAAPAGPGRRGRRGPAPVRTGGSRFGIPWPAGSRVV